MSSWIRSHNKKKIRDALIPPARIINSALSPAVVWCEALVYNEMNVRTPNVDQNKLFIRHPELNEISLH